MLNHKNKNTWIQLTLILFVAAFLRFYGIDFGDPYIYHPDETKLVSQAGRLLDTKFMDKDAYFGIRVYPPFYTYMLTFVMAGYIAISLIIGRFESLHAVKIAYETDAFQFVLLSRYLAATLGVACVLLIFAIGLRLYSKKVGLLAAILAATNFILVRNSHFGTVDIPSTFFGLAAIYFCVLVMQQGRVRDYVLSALFIALVTATKFSMLLFVLPLVFAHLSRYSLRQWGSALLDKKIWLAAVSGFVFFLIACPLIWLDFQETWGGILGTSRFESVGKIGSGGGFLSYWTGDQSAGFGVFYPNSIPAVFGIGLTLISLFALVYLFVRHRNSDLLLLVCIVPIYLMFEKMSIKAMRHILPIMPLLLLASAAFMMDIFYRFKKRGIQVIGFALVIIFLIVTQAALALSYQNKLAKVDPRTTAAAWVNQHIPAGAAVAVESFPPFISIKADSQKYIIYKTNWTSRSQTQEQEFFDFAAEHDSFYYIADDFTRQIFSWKFTKEKYSAIAQQRLSFFSRLDESAEKATVFISENPFIQPAITIYRVTNFDVADKNDASATPLVSDLK